ncbi:MAG: hypothetical protein WBF04_24750 [Candidatus Sulfotelmatobacter sp.]
MDAFKQHVIVSVTLLVALNEYAEEAEEKLQVLFGLRQREGVDGEVPRFLTCVTQGYIARDFDWTRDVNIAATQGI